MLMMKRLLAAIFAAVFAFAIQLRDARAEVANLAVIVFPGVQNLPMFAAQANGFYTKRGLSIDLKFTPNSDELRNGLAVVDAINTAYAFQLYEMLRQKGLNKGDYEVKSVGGTGFRAMTKDKAMVVAIMNPPFSIRGEKAGLKDMGTVFAVLGAYQGTTAFVLRSWGKANADTRVKYLEAYVEGWRWSFDPKNKAEAIKLLAERLKLPEDIAILSYDSTRDGFNRDGAIDMEGVNNMLKLRA